MVFDDEEEERPKKRFKTNGSGFKKRKSSLSDPNPTVADSEPNPLPVREYDASDHPQRDPNPNVPRPEVPPPACSSSERWQAVFEEAKTFAPRVGNTRCPADSTAWSHAQTILETTMKITDMFVRRGTERFQVPLQAPASHQFPLRYTVCLHRETSAIHDLGLENWHESTRAQRIRKCIPCKLIITMFGCSPEIESAPAKEVADDAEKTMAPSEPPTAIRVSGNQGLPAAVHERTSNVPCEGWAPPPVPLHGPKFRLLNAQEKQDLVKLHKNLGHPDPIRLAHHLKEAGAHEHVIEAAKEYICDACVETSKFRHQRPAKLHDPKEFNELLGIDGFFWTGRRLQNRHLEHVVPVFKEMWMSWAGQPTGIYSDPAGEFRAGHWLDFLQQQNIEPRLSTEAWQKGRIERHGQIIKNMLDRFDREKKIEDVQELDQVLQSCFQAKNALARHQGFSPEQIVLGKATKVPASLTSDEHASAHSLADGSDLESEVFRRNLDIRSRARRMFVLADNDSAIRRALLRKSQPHPGTYEIVDAAETENVLSCYEISDFLQEDPIHEWNVFQSGTESSDICLAEDGLPLLDVASAGKRARAEVQIKDLTAAERRLFDTAKEAELSCWLQTSLIGSLQYATTNTRPDVAAKLGEIQVQLSKPTVSTLMEANKVLREAFRQMHAAVVVTDCKSLYDLVSRRAMPSCEEYRTTLEVLLIK
ncbi:unnamed protein product, partial [Cladocopium goreaui]